MMRISNKSKVDSLFRPNKEGYSDKVDVEEIMNCNLPWCKNGAGRRGVFFNVPQYNWGVERGKGNAIASLKLDGFNNATIFNQTIRKDIKDKLKQKTRSNFAPDCLVPLVDKDKEIDHRWGRKDSPLYSRINDTKKQSIDDFQLLSHSHNQLKREECKKCKETNVRWDKVKWDNNVGCAGCPLAQPELYRGGVLTKVSL